MAKRLHLAVPRLLLVADNAVKLLRNELTVKHLGAGDLAKLADVVDSLDFCVSKNDFLVFGRKKIEHAVLDVIEKLVDDAEGVDLHAVMTSLALDARIVGNIKAHDNRLARSCRLDIRKRDITCASADNPKRDLLALDLTESLNNRLKRALRIGLDDHIKLTLALGSHAAHESIECGGLRVGKLLLLALAGGFLRQCTGALFVEHDAELGSRIRNTGKTGSLDGSGRRRLLDAAAVIVNKSANLAEMLSDENRIAHLERTARNEQGSARAKALLKLGLDNKAVGAAGGIGHKLKNFRLNENIFKKLVNALASLAGNRTADNITTPILRRKTALLELLLNAIDIGSRLVSLRDSHHNLNACLTRNSDTFLRLRHDAVIGSDNQNCDIGNLRTAATHCAECRVTRSIKERNFLASDFHLIGANLLSDAACFASGNMLLADPVHKRRLAVVNVTEEGNDRCARPQSLGRIIWDQIICVDGLENRLRSGLIASMLNRDSKAILLRNLRSDIRLNALIDGRENFKSHEIGNEAVGLDVELRGQILDDNRSANGNFTSLLIDGNAATWLNGSGRRLRNALIKRTLSLAPLLVLPAAAIAILVINHLRRTRLRLRRNRNLNLWNGSCVLKRLEERSGKACLGRLNGLGNGDTRLNTRRHTNRRLLGINRNRNLGRGRRNRCWLLGID